MALIETQFTSPALDLSLGMNVILPEHPEAWSAPPAVLYLLHGLSDNHTMWSRRTSIERYASNYNLAIVMPDAHKSFYGNMAYGSNYWKFLADELPETIARWFNVSTDRKKTFIAGLSMGGYGAIKLALGRPDQYAAAASLSGALDIGAHIHDDWDESHRRTFEAAFGGLEELSGSENDLIYQLKTGEPHPNTDFYICVGTEDFLYQDAITFRDTAIHAGLRITYEEAPGDHTWDFWDTYIQRVLEWLPIQPLKNP